MRAIQVTALVGPSALALVDMERPAAQSNRVLIDVEAAGVAWPDLLQTRGLYQVRPEPPYVPGFEVAGRVRSAPDGSGLIAGQRVAALTWGNGWQATTTAAVGNVFPIPDQISAVTAAGFLLNYLTVHFALRRRTVLHPGESVLVHGATGGIGEATLGLARAWGASTIAVVSTEAKATVARRMGADHVVLSDGFLSAVKDLTGGRGVDVVVDPVGGDRFTDSLRSLATSGRLLVIGFTGGQIPTVKVNRLLLNNVAVIGVAWRAYSMGHPGYPLVQWEELLPLISSGALPLPEPRAYPLEQAGEVLEEMEARRVVGNCVLTL